MNPKLGDKILIKAMILAWSIFFLNYFATEYSLYYTFSWFDMMMHTLGGLFIALTFSYFLITKNFSINFYKIVGAVLLIGVSWEVFEFAIGTISILDYKDSLSDIFFDFIGAICGYVYFRINNKVI